MMQTNFSISFKPNIPKYKQIASYLTKYIIQSSEEEEALPSINYLSEILEVSRDTVEKAYQLLKKQELVKVVAGKGYFRKRASDFDAKRIFLLFNKLSGHKRIIYQAFISSFGQEAEIDFHVYNNDFIIFKQLLENVSKTYSHYVIIPHFYAELTAAKDLINKIPKHKLLLLDKKVEGLQGDFASVHQNFSEDIYNSLEEVIPLLSKYDKLILVFPSYSYQPKEIIYGFQRFCKEFNIRGEVVNSIDKKPICKGAAYITMMEDDLVALVKKIKANNLKVGQEIGILSYNESPLKEVLLDGITVMSTDFEHMGITAAKMILENRKEQFKNPFRLIIRQSL